MKRTVPLIITAIAGTILILVEFVPVITGLKEQTESYFQIIAGMAAILGAASLLNMHGNKIRRGSAGWGYSLITVLGFSVTLVVGLLKIGVPPQYGLTAYLVNNQSDSIAEVRISDRGVRDAAGELVRQRTLIVNGYDLPLDAGATVPLTLGGRELASLPVDEAGRVTFELTARADELEPDSAGAYLLNEVTIPRTVLRPGETATAFTPPAVALGDVLSGSLAQNSRFSGDYTFNGSPFWYSYEYFIRPLQSTMFALLAFYVASAAFRAFRARNAESVILLGTAFIILLGRTFVGTWLTDGLPEEGGWSFFHIPNLTSWLMMTFNTAGNRAIMIGIALGIASTSLKILLGIDRSYLGSDER